MTTFGIDAPVTHPPDFLLLRDLPASLFRPETVLLQTTAALQDLGYWIVEVDAERWDTAGMYAAIASALDFPAHFGHNLAALNDCLSDVAEGEYGWPSNAAGLAVVVRHFDTYWTHEKDRAQALVDVAVRQSRYGMLFGHRILWLLQASDHMIEMEPVGAQRPPWAPWGAETGSGA